MGMDRGPDRDSRGLNWTKVGLKLYPGRDERAWRVRLNWTKVGLKFRWIGYSRSSGASLNWTKVGLKYEVDDPPEVFGTQV